MQAITPPGPLLQLTLFLGVLAEFTSGSILDWLVSTTALLTGVTELKSHEAMLMLNLTGALVDGIFYAWEHTVGPRSTEAWVIYGVRNGFFAVYTSFAAVGVFAGSMYAAAGFNQAVGYIAMSVAGGVASHAVGRVLGTQIFGDAPPPDVAGDAGAKTAELANVGPGTALAAQTGMLAIGAVIATQWFAATTLEEGVVVDNTAEAAITTIGIGFAAAGVLVGEKLVPDDVRANRRQIILSIVATYMMATKLVKEDHVAAETTPGYARALTAGVIGEKFVGSFCGSASAYCPTMATVANEIRKVGVAGGGSVFVADAVAVTVCSVGVAYIATIGTLPPFMV